MSTRRMKHLPWFLLTAILASNIIVSSASAAALIQVNDTLIDSTISVATGHTIQFVAPGGLASSGYFTLTFDSGFTGIGAFNTWVSGDVAVNTAAYAGGVCGAFTALTTDAVAISGTLWSHSASGQILTILGPSAVVATNTCIKITLNGATHKVTNPGSAGSYKITIASSAGDSGALAVPILAVGASSVAVTATISPVITFTLSATTCSLAAMSATAIKECGITSTVTTNAINGYTAFVKDGVNDVFVGALVHTDLSHSIPAYTGTLLAATATLAGFGVSSNGGGAAAATGGASCGDLSGSKPVTMITNNNLSYATLGVAADGITGQKIVCFTAKPSATTPAGTYTRVLTFTAVANF